MLVRSGFSSVSAPFPGNSFPSTDHPNHMPCVKVGAESSSAVVAGGCEFSVVVVVEVAGTGVDEALVQVQVLSGSIPCWAGPLDWVI